MCNQTNQELIEEVVSERVENEELFTAYDISREVQNRARNNGTPFERHRDMKNYIHNVMQDYLGVEYVKTLHRIGDNNAIVYHPPHRQAAEYVSGIDEPAKEGFATYGPAVVAAVQENRPPQHVFNAQQVADVVSSWKIANQSDKIINLVRNYGVDGRGSLIVPAKIVREAGFQPKQKVYVGRQFHSLHIVDEDFIGSDASYTVDDYGNIRITAGVVKLIGDGSYNFKVEQGIDRKYIVVDRAKN